MFTIKYRDREGVEVTYSGRRFEDYERDNAVHAARSMYHMVPKLYPSGIRAENWRGDIVWSIGAQPTFRVQVWHERRQQWCDMVGNGVKGIDKDAAETRVTQLSRLAQHGFEMGADKVLLRYRVLQEIYPMELVAGRPVSLARTA